MTGITQPRVSWILSATLLIFCHHLNANLIYTTSVNYQHLNGGQGKDGICQKYFRVLQQTKTNPRDYCSDYYNSDLGKLEDLAGFYNSIINVKQKNETLISLAMDDKLGEFWMKLDIFISGQVFLSPELVNSMDAQHILCVQKIKCPATTTTTTTTSTTSTSTSTTGRPLSTELMGLPGLVDRQSENFFTNELAFARLDSDSFWRLIFENTDPKSWVISTIMLSIFSLILFIALILVSICFCRIKSAHLNEKCYGTCKYGCRCDPDVIRQVSMDSKYFRSLTSNANTPIVTRINGGTLRSNGGNSSTYQPINRKNQLFVSLASQDDHSPNAILSHACMNGTTATNTLNRNLNNWNNSGKRVRRMSQEAIQRSISEGSSVSGHTAPPNLLAQKGSLIQNTTSKLLNFMQNNVNRGPSPNHFYQPSSGTTYLGSNFINGPYMTHGSPNSTKIVHNGLLSRKPDGRYFMKGGNIDEVDEDSEQIVHHHMTLSNVSDSRMVLNRSDEQQQSSQSINNNHNNSTKQHEMNGDHDTNISPPLGFFDQSQENFSANVGGVQFSGMMGSTGSFLSNGLNSSIKNGPIKNNAWSNCSSPHNNSNNNNIEIPSLPPRDLNNCSDESNDSGKSSGHPSAGTSNGLPKLSSIFHDCGPPIVSQAPIFLNRTSNYTST